MNKIKKIGAAALTAVMLATPVTGALPDVMSVTASAAVQRIDRTGGRDDGIWLFPLAQGNYNFTDWAGCIYSNSAYPKCRLCGGSHTMFDMGDEYHAPGQFNGVGHNGVDLNAGDGTSVMAAAGGTVRVAEYWSTRGLTIVIEHPIAGTSKSYYSYYQHLSQTNVAVGDTVTAGTVIAKSGHSGGDYGSHLHFGIVLGDKGCNIKSNLFTYECSGFLMKTDGYSKNGGILTNPSLNSPAPNLPSVSYHSGSVTYTFDKSKVSIGGAANGSHEHNYVYQYYWEAHPHHNYYECSCGDGYVDYNSSNYCDWCEECNSPHEHNFLYQYYWEAHPHHNYYECSCGDGYVDYNSSNYCNWCEECNPPHTHNHNVAEYDSTCDECVQSLDLDYLEDGFFLYITKIYNRNSEKNLIIPAKIDGKNVTGIYRDAFTNCASLTSVTIPDSVTEIGVNMYSHMLPCSCEFFEGCTSLTKIEVDAQNKEYTSVDGVLFSKDKTKLVCCPNGKSTSYVIPNGVTEIGMGAFCDCTSLTSVSIPKSVTDIGYGAFGDCTSLTKIEVDAQNKNYTSVDGVLFNKDKTRLICYPNGKSTSYVIPNGVTDIGIGAFCDCTSLTSISIPKSVTEIGMYAFLDCTSLETVTIPNSVTDIEEWAFSGCTSLKTVNYTGSKDEWKKINSWIENDLLLNATINYNYTGTPDPTPNPTPEPTPNPDPKNPVFNSQTNISGDVDGDGRVNTTDATAILMYNLGLATFEGNSEKNSDVNGDGRINTIDATQILKQVLGLA